MTISDALYTYGIKDKKIDKLVNKMHKHKFIRNLYVVVSPITGDGILEIYVYNQLLQPFYREVIDKVRILGIARGRQDAYELILQMVQDMYDAGDGDDIDTEFFVREA